MRREWREQVSVKRILLGTRATFSPAADQISPAASRPRTLTLGNRNSRIDLHRRLRRSYGSLNFAIEFVAARFRYHTIRLRFLRFPRVRGHSGIVRSFRRLANAGIARSADRIENSNA